MTKISGADVEVYDDYVTVDRGNGPVTYFKDLVRAYAEGGSPFWRIILALLGG